MATATQLQDAARTKPTALAEAFAKTLRDFGYTSITMVECRDQINAWLQGSPPKGIIGMFIYKWLNQGME